MSTSSSHPSAQILEWLANGQVGSSSKTMAIIALGVTPKRIEYPAEPDDLNRCLLLLKTAPEVREAFPQIAASSKVWAALIERWDAIEQCFLAEVGLNWSKAHNAPTTYNMMRKAIDSARK